MVYESLLKEMENRGVLLNEERKAFEERLQAEEKARHEEMNRNLVSRNVKI